MKRNFLVRALAAALFSWLLLGGLIAAGDTPKLGLDLRGGFSVVLEAPAGTDPEVMAKAVEIMRQRIEGLGGVQEPEISVQGDNSILVQLPGVENRERALEAVGTTGTLSFRPVLARSFVSPAFQDGTLPLPDALQTTSTLPDTAPTTTVPGTETTTTTTIPDSGNATPIPDNLDPETGLTISDEPNQTSYLAGDDGFVYEVGPAFLTGSDITGATPQFGQQTGGRWVVIPQFTSDGAKKFEDGTASLTLFPPNDPRRAMAIVVDGIVTSAPTIDSRLQAGESLNASGVQITIGSSDDPQAEAQDLASILRYGALPTELVRQQLESVSASLGSDSLRAGLIAGLAGLIVVAFALVAYYRILGVVAVVGLTIFGSLLIAALILMGNLQGTTLTLAGVTGIIVSVGITSDSYIVFFERIKEEHRKGRPLRPSVDQGFDKAFSTILKGDTVTFIGSVLLWLLAIGPVKGFAITLGVATVIDVIVAYYFTRPAVMYLVRSKLGEGGKFSIRGATGRTKDEITGVTA
ncbi:MAG: protein translocase subunit SecD [Actinobacteria bacterium]|nr:protein translocase subunit SecD [Actinomycetota bacterium]